MALEKKILTDTGLEAKYWIVARVEIDKIAEQGLVTMYGYLDEAHRQAGGGFLDRRFFNVYPNQFNEVFSLESLEVKNPYEIAYNLVKKTDTFTQAKDLLEKVEPELGKEEAKEEIGGAGLGKLK